MILTIGEVVWDVFPDGRQVLGGAPVNVAYHLNCLGVEVHVITAVGDDELGSKTIETLKSLKIPHDGLQKNGMPTGVVKVSFDAKHEPCFDIVAPAAWDAIDAGKALNYTGNKRFDLVYGTLAQRDERSRAAISELRKMASLRFYDVNLRPPHTDDREIVYDSMKSADLVKVNARELKILAQWYEIEGFEKKETALALLDSFDNAAIVVTEGAEGAWVVTKTGYFSVPGVSVEVADTVGSGDAFFAAVIKGYTTGISWEKILAVANKRGAYVASKTGATPPMPE